MSKEDVPLPAFVPRKRRAVEAILPVHLATWLASDGLTSSERRVLEAERARRRALEPKPLVVGVIASSVGQTPAQIAALREALEASGATALRHAFTPGKVHAACKATGLPVVVVGDYPTADRQTVGDRERQVVQASDLVVALPHERSVMPYATPGSWAMIGYARNRNLPVRVISPDGELLQGEGA